MGNWWQTTLRGSSNRSNQAFKCSLKTFQKTIESNRHKVVFYYLGIGLGLSLEIAHFWQVQNEMYALGIGLGIVFCVKIDAQTMG